MKVYNKITPYYDLMVDWDDRLKVEDPFFLQLLREQLGSSVLDLGCGTGGHTLHWSEMGYYTVGIDSSSDMIKEAKRKAEEMDVEGEFHCLPMTDFTTKIQQQFDLVVCVGNTVAHIIDPFNLKKMFEETAKSVKPNGSAVFHILNYYRILEQKKRDFPVKSRIVDGKEYLIIRFYDFHDNILSFNYVVAVKEDGHWTSRSFQMMHKPWLADELTEAALAAGFKYVMKYGGYDFSEFDIEKNDELILVCDFSEE